MSTIDEINSFIKMKSKEIEQAKLNEEKAKFEAMKNPLSDEETQTFLTHLLEQGNKGTNVYGSGFNPKHEAFVEWYLPRQTIPNYKMIFEKGVGTVKLLRFSSR